MARHQGRTALYRLFDQSGQLLYVGVSHKPDVRWGEHSVEKDWWPLVDQRKVEWYDTRLAAEGTESQVVAEECPVFNVVGTLRATIFGKIGKTPLRPVRVGGDLWKDFGQSAAATGSDRSATLRAFMEWHAGRPGAKLPVRPAVVQAQPETAE
jgi:hypothetical protein